MTILSSIILFYSCKKNKEEKKINQPLVEIKNEKTPNLEFLWETDSVFKTPESALFDNARNVIYVSNVNLNPRKKDGNGFISKLDKNGNIIELEWIKDMSSPKGLGLYGNTLYVTDVDEVISINVETNSIIKRYPFTDAGMLNDISIDRDGTVFITDMDTGEILTLKDQTISLWKSNIVKPNGIFVEENRILIASADSKFTEYDKTSKEAKVICNGISRGDGIEIMNSGSYLVSNWKGELFLVKNGTLTLLLSTKEKNIETADIGIIKEENIVLIPTFFNNKLVAYKVNE
ncbi:hypothetical protein [Thalassobellus sediminis]|uniref:hypothetical protein n=1 Tax=Thalassobellus sediminis TaxID=3367753 RepID=UPI0037B8A3A7